MVNNWDAQVAKSSFDSDKVVSDIITGRNRGDVSGRLDLRTGGYKYNKEKVEVGFNGPLTGYDYGHNDYTRTSGYNMVGIKGGEVENMRQAIREYVSAIQNEVETTLQSSAEKAYAAFRGEDAITAVNLYIDKVKSYCMNMTSSLLAFSDKLADVGNAWIAAQSNIAGTVETATAAFSEGTQYSEQVTYQGH